MLASTIIQKGYLPKELPPPFNTNSLANQIASNSSSLPKKYFPERGSGEITKPVIHNLARAGTLRRRLAIPNPISFHELALVVHRKWPSLAKFVKKSPISLSTPTQSSSSDRAISPKLGFDALPIARARTRAGMRYLLKTDISTFYPSIYSHSIPWALHTKALAKKNRDTRLTGNLLDYLIRSAQDGQTVGIPIGPDTSLLIAEILLTDIDIRCTSLNPTRAFRYVDDYEIAYSTFAEAESGLSSLQEILSEYELQLNPRKTSIVQLPLPLDGLWATELRVHQIRNSTKAQSTDIHSFFTKAFSLLREYPDESILKYAIARFRSVKIEKENWDLYQDILLQCATVEPGTLDSVITELAFFSKNGFQVNLKKLASTLTDIILFHAPLAHGSEVAWAIWGCILFSIKLGRNTTDKLTSIEDSTIALLALHANALGLLHANAQFDKWRSYMNYAGLMSHQWLLSYEAHVKGWLPAVSGKNYVSSHTYFSWLKDGGVSFYDVDTRPIRESKFVSYDEEESENDLIFYPNVSS